MAKDNFFMDVLCIQILNIGVATSLPVFFLYNDAISYDKEVSSAYRNLRRLEIPLSILSLIIWIYVIWKGT
jgi:surface polysaccharide O-acyltransferase-like enzyme